MRNVYSRKQSQGNDDVNDDDGDVDDDDDDDDECGGGGGNGYSPNTMWLRSFLGNTTSDDDQLLVCSHAWPLQSYLSLAH